MRAAPSALVFALGLFALVAQTLLLRTWLGTFEGTELSLGAFFGSWLLWVALGARLGRRLAGQTTLFVLALAYVPAFLLQSELTFGARELAGVPVYEVLPMRRLLYVAGVVNLPVSLLTGALFSLACRTRAGGATLPVARVWVLECLGAFVGGVGGTLLLARGVEEATVFGGTALLLTLAAGAAWLAAADDARTRRRRVLAAALPVLGIGVALAAGLPGRWTEARDRATWARVLPSDAYVGHFATAQGRYLLGTHPPGVHTVLAWGVTTEVAFDAASAGAIVAVHMSQAPHARRVLLVGPGALASACAFSALPQIADVGWLHPDPEYPGALRRAAPAAFAGAAKVTVPGEDVRAHLRRSRGRYDIVVVHLPDVTTLVANRYATQEFLELVAGALAEGGVASLRIRGGENVLGPERARLGASALYTLESVFPRVVIKPGEETFLLASRDADLTTEPAVLRDRFAAIDGAASVYPPEAVPSLMLPDRVAFQTDRYRAVIEAAGTGTEADARRDAELLNTDARPKALLYGLILSTRAAGSTVPPETLSAILRVGPWILAFGLVLFALLPVLARRLERRRRAPGGPRASSPDATVLVFTTGLVGMALAMLWMFLFQSRYGTLYLHVGLVSALFMIGLVVGGAGITRLLSRREAEPSWLIPAGLALLAVALFAPLALPVTASPAVFFFGVAFAGFASGLFLPLAAYRLRAAGRGPGDAGAALETADHLGGAVGAAATGIFLLPLFGVPTTLLLLVGLVATNLAPRLAPQSTPSASPWGTTADRRLRTAGWILAGVTLWVLVGSWALSRESAVGHAASFERAARELSAGATLERETTRRPGGDDLTFFRVLDAEGRLGGWILDTRTLAPDVVGYGGTIELVARVDPDGALRSWLLIRSRETPAYVALLDPWREELTGRNLFAPGAFEGVDAVSGATITADAVLAALEEAGRAFARDVLGRPVDGTSRARASAPWRDGLVLVLLTLIAISLRWVPNPWVRRAWLALVFGVAGLWLNAQYSSQQVFALLQGEVPALLLGASFYLVVIVPLVVVFFGNVYCGWLCPFGAAQELLGDLGRRRWESDPHRRVWSWGRAVKYGLLGWILLATALSGRREVLGADPLVTFFSGAVGGATLLLAVAALGLSLVFGRFFCRTLCPAGAFLAILNRVRLLRRWLPPARPGRCDLGVRTHHELDCICCDRCRHAPAPSVHS